MIPLFLALTVALSQTPGAPAPPDAGAEGAPREPDESTVEPAGASPLYRLGLAYLAQSEPKKAIKPLEQLLKESADSLDALLLLARAYRGANEKAKAVALLDKAIGERPDDAALRSERALLARAAEDYATAIAQYGKAVELQPEDADLVFNLGEAQHKAGGQLVQAVSTYRRVLVLNPQHLAAKVNLAKALSEKGFFGEAKDVLRAACAMPTADAEAHYNLGVLLMREGDLAQASTAFERALTLAPKHGPSLNNLGVAQEARGDTKKAAETFKRAALADPTSAESSFNLGLALMKLNRTLEAAKAFEQALQREPGSSGPYVQLGTLYLRDGRNERAVEAFSKAVSALDAKEKDASAFRLLTNRFNAERTTDAYRGLALAYLAQGKASEAVATLSQAVGKLPKDASARRALGEAYLVQGNLEGAVEQLKARLELEPTTEAKLDLARAYTKKRVAKEAEPLYRAILKEDVNQRGAKLGLADLYLAMGRFGEGEALLKELLTTDPGDAPALARFGILKSRMGRPDEALEPLARAVELNPALYDARAEYGLLLYRADPEGNVDRCIRTMNDVLTAEPRHTLSLHYLGVCLYAQGNPQRAEASFRAAIAVDPTFPAAHFSLGELFENAGKKDEAKKEYGLAAKLGHVEASDALKRL